MENDYKLIQPVDPTKFNIPINDRFAKLTLSSNKKKKQQEEAQERCHNVEKRESASCNLLSVLNEVENSTTTKNPLLRSDSSSSIDEAHNNSSMDILQVTDDEDNNIDEEIEKLSQKVSNINMQSEEHIDESVIISSDEGELSEEEEESVILVSDSSKSSDSFQTTLGYQDTMSMAVSNSDSLGSFQLPQEEEKSRLIQAFLQDVEQAQLHQVQIIDNEILSLESKTITESIEVLTKAKMIASADTESMTPTGSIVSQIRQRSITGRDTLSMSECQSLLDSIEQVHDESQLQSGESEQKSQAKGRDTLSMSECPSLLDSIEQVHDESQLNSEESPQKSQAIAENDTVVNTLQNFTELENESINQSKEVFAEKSTQPNTLSEVDVIESDLEAKSLVDEQDSVIISETSSEEIEQRTCRSSGVAVRSSVSSIATEDSWSSQPHINISATINVRIHISHQSNHLTEEVEEVESEPRPSLPATESNETYCSEVPEVDEILAGTLNQAKTHENENDIEAEKPDENFINHAEKVLNELYGNTWRTPQMLRTLKNASVEKRATTTSGKSKAKNREKEQSSDENSIKPTENESVLHDFSIFRKNIVRTNLDSTRFTTLNKTADNDVFKTPVGKPMRVVVQKPTPTVPQQSENEDINASDDSDVDDTFNEKSYSESSSSTSNNENINTTNKKMTVKKKPQSRKKAKDDLVYFDLTKEEVSIITTPNSSPPANHDVKFDQHLEDILRTCRAEDKPKMPSAVKSGSKRRLFTPNLGYEDEDIGGIQTPPQRTLKPLNLLDKLLDEDDDEEDSIHFQGQLLPPGFEVLNKPLESVKKGRPIFKITPVKTTPKSSKKTTKPFEEIKVLGRDMNYTFLKSLEVEVSKCYCHPDALVYRENFRQKKHELVTVLYNLFNEKVFDKKLDVPIKWNKKLTNTAGRCMNKRKQEIRSSVVELSEKVLTSADRLRCTLIHELCHAATWIFDGENGHGATWKAWARRANTVFPELPKIGVCHQYDIEYKYTYKCTLCGAKSHAHTKSKKVENIRCAFCHGAIEVFLNRKDKDGNIMPTPVREPTGFAKFVKESYKKYKQPDLKHADVMKILSNEFAALKVNGENK